MLSLLLIEDQTLMRQGLRTLLDLEPGMTVVGEAADGEAGVRLALDLRPDVVLMDVQIVDNTGEQADVFLYERGWSAFATVGRIFPLFGPNPNSGLHLKLGGGYLRHKVRVQTQKNVVPQLEDEYLEGYDRLSAGPAALAYLGYQHLSNKGRVNFHIGLEFMAGFTQALRAYNFDTEQYNTPNRLDLLSGVRAGWSLPIYKKLDTGFHYY